MHDDARVILPQYSFCPKAGDCAFLLVGFLAFCLVTDISILNPTWVGWLTSGDMSQHWLGWQFFREAPLWQFPFGKSGNWGMEIGGSIVFTDSIPLLAMAFKPFSGLLPHFFQYFGPWILLCFILQAYFADRIARLFTKDRLGAALCSILFVLAPPMLWRLHGHIALFSHWLLLASIYLYCAQRLRPLAWAMLSGAAALVHGYIFVVVFLVFLADLARRALARELSPIRIALLLSANTAWVLLLMATAGYFVLGGEVGLGGFGIYRLNLDSLINSYGKWSLFLPGLPEKPGEYEGFNFLGLGGMLVVGTGAIALPFSLKRGTSPRFILPLALLFVLLFLFAISNKIAFSTHELLHIALPPRIETLVAPFRASGRFFWLGWYLLVLACLALTRVWLGRTRFTLFALLAVTAQCVDISPALRHFHQVFSDPPRNASPLASPAWDILASRYGKLVRVFPKNDSPDWMPFSYLAMSHHMRTNFGYFARVDSHAQAAARTRLADAIMDAKLPSDALYVFDDDLQWFTFLASHPGGYAGVLDGYRIFAPGVTEEEARALPGRKAAFAEYSDEFCVGMDAVLDFGWGGNGLRFLGEGWDTPVKGAKGAWSKGETASLVFAFDRIPERPVDLCFDFSAFVPNNRRQTLAMSVNGSPVRTFMDYTAMDLQTRLTVTPETLRKSNGVVAVRMRFPDRVTPMSLGINPDPRELAYCIKSLRFEYSPEQATPDS